MTEVAHEGPSQEEVVRAVFNDENLAQEAPEIFQQLVDTLSAGPCELVYERGDETDDEVVTLRRSDSDEGISIYGKAAMYNSDFTLGFPYGSEVTVLPNGQVQLGTADDPKGVYTNSNLDDRFVQNVIALAAAAKAAATGGKE